MKFRVLFAFADGDPMLDWQDMGCDFDVEDAKAVLWSLAHQGMQVKLQGAPA